MAKPQRANSHLLTARVNKIAVISASGMGDGLIMLIAAHHLRKLGHQVTVFNQHLPSFGRWLEDGEYLPPPLDWKEALDPFDAILLQHDNTPKAKKIAALRNEKKSVYIFYPTYLFSKHGSIFQNFDYIFDINQTMVENTREGIQTLFGSLATYENGMKQLPGLVHRKYNKRVMIHPTSGSPDKNWPKNQFIQLSVWLKNQGFDPIFIVEEAEQPFWKDVNAPLFLTLESLTSAIYESGYFIGNDSGPGHLASYLSIPHLIIAKDERNMQLWRPGWHQGKVIFPPRWVPNFKCLRLRENFWKQLITKKMVINSFKTIIK